MKNVQTAQDMLAPYMGKPIMVGGSQIMADGGVETYFSARMDLRDQNRLGYLATSNGSVQPDYTLEQMLLGGAVTNKVIGTVGRALGALDATLAGEVVASPGGFIATGQVTNQGMTLPLSAADRAMLSQIDNLPNTTLQGDAREFVVNNFRAQRFHTARWKVWRQLL